MSQTKAQLLDPQGDFTLTGQLIGVGATFSGNVSIAGTLTKQDVTNVDSVGVVTARAGIDCDGTATFGANGSITTGGDFTLSGNGLTVTGSTTTVGEFKGATLPTIQITQTTDNTDLQLRANATGGLVRTATNKPLVLGSNQQERLRIGTGGNGVTVGINTTVNLVTGSEVLSVRGYSSFKSYNKDYAAIYTYSEGEGVGNRAAHLLFNWGGANRGGFGVETDNATLILNNQNGISFRTGSTGLNGTERFHIAANGNVGISSSIPQAQLDVAGTFINSRNVNSTGDAGIMVANTHRLGFDQSGTRSWTVRATGGNLEVQSGDGNGALKGASTGGVHDNKGNVRSVPLNTQGSAYTLVANDAGKCILAGNNVTFNNSVMSAGDMVTIINNTNGNISIVAGAGTALYNTADAATGTRTLATRGMATIYFTHDTTGYISGSGLS